MKKTVDNLAFPWYDVITKRKGDTKMNKWYVIINSAVSENYGTIVNGQIYFSKEIAVKMCRCYNEETKINSYKVVELGDAKIINEK